MEREILFKAQAADGSGWIESMTLARGTIKRKCNKMYMEIGVNNWKQVKPETICQFTGLKDNRGNKIFEGDILSHTFMDGYETQNGIVKFINYAFCISFEDKFRPLGSSGLGWEELGRYGYDLEVIGNIHD